MTNRSEAVVSTPRTDAAEDRCNNCGLTFVLAEDARQLEREHAELVAALEQIATVPVDGRGLDYYWKGREIAQATLAKVKS